MVNQKTARDLSILKFKRDLDILVNNFLNNPAMGDDVIQLSDIMVDDTEDHATV